MTGPPHPPTLLPALLLALLALGAAAPPAHAEDQRFALVIGHNDSDDPDLAALRYADDDAVRYAELFDHISARTILLTDLDPETRRLVGERGQGAPTRASVQSALSELAAAMSAAEARGDRPILYFIYSGHGSYDAEGRGYVYLADGRFTTRDLFHDVLAPNRDHPVVLLIDACNAALLVNTRGASDERRPVRPTTLKLEDYPNVGLILASSRISETHEWGRYLAGVFSHEVRSGLLGAADLDDDERITFAELAAFVAAANDRVTNPNVRVAPYIRPPLTDPNLPLTDLSAGRFPARLRVDGRVASKAHLVDADLVRYADFNTTLEARGGFWLVLTRATGFTLVEREREWLIPVAAHGDLHLDELATRPRTLLSARGAGSAYFDRTLFHQPYGRVFAQRYLSASYADDLRLQRAIASPWYDNPSAWTLLGGGVAAALTGAGLHLRAHDLEDEARGAWADQRARLNGDIDTLQTSAAVLYGVGGAALVGGVLLFVLDRPTHIETWDPPLEVELTGRGVRLKTDW